MAFKLGTYYDEKYVKTYDLYEGNITFDTGYDVLNNVRVKIAKFSEEVQDSTFLSLYADQTHELMMAKATGDTAGFATHFNPYEPEVSGGFIPEKDVGETIAFDSYKPRHVGCYEIQAGHEHKFPLYKNNAEIKAGDYLIVRTDSRTLDKIADTATAEQKTLMALENVAANAGQEEILCLTKEARIPVTKA